jgi:hypothetical protein
LQGTLVEAAGLVEIALLAQHEREVVEALGGVRMVRAEASFADGDGALVESTGLVESPWSRRTAARL